MSYLAIAGVLIAVVSIVCCVLIVTSRPLNSIKATWGFFSFTVGLWGIGLFKAYSTIEYDHALFWLRLLNLSAISIPVFFLHFAVLFTKSAQKYSRVVWLSYVTAAFFIISAIAMPGVFIPDVGPKFGFRYYPRPGALYYLFFIFFTYAAVRGVRVLLYDYRRASQLRKRQLKYFLVGLSVGFLGGATTFLPVFGVPVQPYGVFLVPVYVTAVTAISIRYQLIDFGVFLTRTSILIAVYAVVLGLPFIIVSCGRDYLTAIFGESWWVAPLLCSTVTATIGPSLYLFFQRKAENRLLQEQLRYQATLKQASMGMGRIKDLGKLLRLIVHLVTHAVRTEHSYVYVVDLSGDLQLGAWRSWLHRMSPQKTILKDSVLIAQVRKASQPLVLEEVRLKARDYNDAGLMALEREMSALGAAVLIPSWIEDRLIGLLVLGQKVSRRPYSYNDLVVFSILANQAALAIENALFYEDMKRTQEQLFKAEKMATIGIMADGLSHQINNRLHAMGFIAGDMMDTLNLKKHLFSSDELKALEEEFKKGFTRLEENVVHGRNIVQGLMKYTRKGEEGFASCDVEAVLKSAWEMAQFKIKPDRMKIIKDAIDGSGIKVKANFTQLQEVFFNLIDNAYDAMIQRKDDLQEEGYFPTLMVQAEHKEGKVILVFQDNGIGVKDDDREKLFTPFFTTKATSRKGTGLGLYVIRKIIEENHGGRIEMISHYREGTTFRISLPAA